MLILGIESSALVASTALIRDGVLLAEYTLNSRKTHSQTLLPMIKEMADAAIEGDLSQIDGIAVSKGPGSFTGLRIGSATAKGLAFTLDKPILSIPTLDAMAYGLYGISGIVCPIMDARRSQVYTGVYEFASADGGFQMNPLMNQAAMDLGELMDFLNATGKRVTFLGDACQVYAEQIFAGMKVRYSFAPSFASRQRASVVAELGAIYLKEGRVDTAESHEPEYLRKTQAERERDEKTALQKAKGTD